MTGSEGQVFEFMGFVYEKVIDIELLEVDVLVLPGRNLLRYFLQSSLKIGLSYLKPLKNLFTDLLTQGSRRTQIPFYIVQLSLEYLQLNIFRLRNFSELIMG